MNTASSSLVHVTHRAQTKPHQTYAQCVRRQWACSSSAALSKVIGLHPWVEDGVKSTCQPHAQIEHGPCCASKPRSCLHVMTQRPRTATHDAPSVNQTSDPVMTGALRQKALKILTQKLSSRQQSCRNRHTSTCVKSVNKSANSANPAEI